jgi:VanZ like family
VSGTRRQLDAAMMVAGGLVALLTLLPQGGDTVWAAPLAELRWYATGLSSETTLLQLTGNLLLLAPLAVLATLRWPGASPMRLGGAAVAAAVGIELLQWALPLGRVVSPVDAGLNTAGAVLAVRAAAVLSGLRRATAS